MPCSSFSFTGRVMPVFLSFCQFCADLKAYKLQHTVPERRFQRTDYRDLASYAQDC